MATLTIQGAIELVAASLTETEQQFAEATTLLRSVETALAHNDRAEASRLLTDAADILHDFGVDIGELFETLKLDDGAEPR